MRASSGTPVLALAVALAAAACGSTAATPPSPTTAVTPTATGSRATPTPAASSPSSPAVPSPATPSPASATPGAGAVVAGYVEAALAILRDPLLAAEFELGGTSDISGATFEMTGRLAVVGHDIAVETTLQPGDITTGQISTGGQVYLRGDRGRWVRDDQAVATMPAFAEAFAGVVTAGPTFAGSTPDEPALQVNLVGVDLDTLLAATGEVDPGMTGATGTVAMFLSERGELQALVVEAHATPAEGLDPIDLLHALAVTRIGRAGEAGAATVDPPVDFWLRHYSEALGYLIEFPPTMDRATADGIDHYRSKAPHDFTVFGGTLREGASFDAVVDDAIGQLKASGAKVVRDASVTLDGAPARKVTVTWTSGGKAYWAVKTMTLHGDAFYALTWIDLATHRKAGQRILDEMLASFRSGF